MTEVAGAVRGYVSVPFADWHACVETGLCAYVLYSIIFIKHLEVERLTSAVWRERRLSTERD